MARQFFKLYWKWPLGCPDAKFYTSAGEASLRFIRTREYTGGYVWSSDSLEVTRVAADRFKVTYSEESYSDSWG